MKCAVISLKGLGDGIVSMVLSHNLFLNGYNVDTYHKGDFYQLKRWFKHLPIFQDLNISKILSYDKVYVSYDTMDKDILSLIKLREKHPKIKIISPSYSKKKPPFHQDMLFQNSISMLSNFQKFFSKNFLKFKKTNGITCPHNLTFKKYNRIVIHPTSAKQGRSWTKKKFLKLSKKLQQRGFQTAFIVSKNEKKLWPEAISFDNLNDLASYIYESSYFIGNDSGLGHLASSLNIPTLCLCRSRRIAALWRPDFYTNITIYPSPFIPNIRGFRLRDKHWQKFMSTKKALKAFNILTKDSV